MQREELKPALIKKMKEYLELENMLKQ
jgi:UTP--glucose-1-phosphate uridylyltransferase